ncbi:hypothetical protein G7Y89_g14429 [Cudoniella acicularis]|uniref:ATPase AAA-type core domain-containing protein n=1 Tax=Cudoniella acicularis TaxID=354080 RepID=A0A8H4R365_9HELO|nr:hypothetical protein G7Y89_g14429 [Cudoniella acicularis]
MLSSTVHVRYREEGKTSVYKLEDSTWARSIVLSIRHISTIVLDKNIYILSLSAITKDRLRDLFAKLLSRCVILLEDINIASSKRSGDVKGPRQIVTGSPSQQSKSVSGKVALSALLNINDSVASQVGRISVMTTNFTTHLDEALIQPSRVDKKVELELGLVDKKMTADLFYVVFKPVESDVAPPKVAQLDVLVREDRKVHEAARSQEEEVKSVEQLAEEFAARVAELEFSPAEILSFLLGYGQSPRGAINNVKAWIARIREERKKAKNEV